MSLIKDLDFNGPQDKDFSNNDSLMESNISLLSALKGRNFRLGLKRHRTDLVYKWTLVHFEVALRKKSAIISKALFNQ